MEVYQGRCVGGPMRGHWGESRFPRGFVLVDRKKDTAWVYEWRDGKFVVQEPNGVPLDHDKRWSAADGAEWDVRAR